MKQKCLFIILFACIPAFAGNESPYKTEIDTAALDYIRKSYYAAVEMPESVEVLIEYIESRYSSNFRNYNPIILSYYACLTGLKGKYDSNVYNKVKYVNQGIAKIDSAVSLFPDCFEIRFLRFSFYHFLPDFFNVKEKRKNDALFVSEMLLKKDYSFVDQKIQNDMLKFITGIDRVSEDTKKKLRKIII
ncbi:MAG: hypothetical protein PHW02_05695 [bacterium]|nr:hypothetical protein [bacterium]